MHDFNKSLDELSRSIGRAERKISTDNTDMPRSADGVDYERLARERAERELYAARYKEQLLRDSAPEWEELSVKEPEASVEPEPECEIDVSEYEAKSPDPQPRVTEKATKTTEYTDSSARILTIPGAVYRIPSEPTGYTPEASTTVVPVVGANVESEVAPLYVEALADESADDFFSSVTLPPDEPQSKITQPAVADAAEEGIDAREQDYALSRGDDAGEYTVPVEYSAPEPVSNEQHPIAVPHDPAHEAAEYERFLAEHEQKRESPKKSRRAPLDKDADPYHFSVDAIEKSVKLVEARMLYEIESMKAEHRMLGYTFSMDVLKKDRTDNKMRRQISRRMYLLSRALKRERADAKRYYTASLDKYLGSPDKRAKNTVVLDSVLTRLDYALKERERIDESLMRLYGEGTPGKDAVKEMKVGERAARYAYKAQLKTAKRVARMHAPTELKEKIFELMNERVKLLSDIERNTYLLSQKRYTGAGKRAVKRQNRALKRTARQREEDIRFFIKKAEKHNESHGVGMHQLGWLVGTVLVIGVLAALYFLAKYYWRLF